jgi:hypothetical protein
MFYINLVDQMLTQALTLLVIDADWCKVRFCACKSIKFSTSHVDIINQKYSLEGLPGCYHIAL